MTRRFFLGMGCLLLVAAGAIATTLHIPDPMVYVQSPQIQQEAPGLLDGAFRYATQLLEGRADVDVGGPVGRGDAEISVMVIESEGNPMITMSLTSRTGANGVYNYASPWQANSFQEIAAGIAYLYLMYVENVQPAGTPPRLLSVLGTSSISTAGIGDIGAGYPIDIAVAGDGELLLADSQYIVRLDRYYRELAKIGGRFLDQVEAFAYKLFVSPSGEITTIGTSGTPVWRVPYDSADPRAIMIPGTAYGGAGSTDGTVVLLDPVQQRAFRVLPDDQVEPININASPYMFPTVIAGGPDNTFWTWDAYETRIAIFSTSGQRLGGIVPLLPYEQRGTVYQLLPYPDGSVAVVTQTHIHKFDRLGMPQWSIPAADIADVGSFYGNVTADFDPDTGIIHILANSKLYQLLDVEYSEQHGGIDPLDQQLMDLMARVGPLRNNLSALSELGPIYEELGAWELALDTWSLASSLSPNDPAVANGLLRARIEFAWRDVERAIERAERLLAQYGPANAQQEYNRAMIAIERLLALIPGDEEVAARRGELDAMFAQTYLPLEVTDLEVENLFPALYQQYRTRSVGTVTVANRNSAAASNVTVSVQLGEYMSSPWITPSYAAIPSDGSHEFEIRLPLDSSVLGLTATANGAPLTVTVRYEVGGDQRESTTIHPVVLYRNSALTWEDSRKLASFIVPADTYVREFSTSFASPANQTRDWDISERILRAMRVVDALGAYGIEYIEDPRSGIADILGSAQVVDTVNYPRNTLRYRSGDCDDTTALLASLLESISINTAIMTSPGHVFLAFDTGEPDHQQWMFESAGTTSISYRGTLWLPIESTVVSDGFIAAWRAASTLVRTHGPADPNDVPNDTQDELEFLPVFELRDSFPELPDLPASFSLIVPSEESVRQLDTPSTAAVRSTIYGDHVAEMERLLRTQNDRQKVRTLNRVGILHARFGETRDAEAAFADAIEIDEDYTSSYLNLANIRLLANDANGAIALLDEVTSRRPDSTLAHLFLAQAYHILGRSRDVAEHMTIVRENAPELAQTYAYLTAGGSSRASGFQTNPVLPWPDEEE
jgi:tetratricopeptide (TPR) repeat protein